MIPILFLDIDGVLNDHAWCHLGDDSPRILPRCVDVLRRIVRTVKPQIVVSSTWARHIEERDVSCVGFEWMLRTYGLHCTIIDGINGRFTAADQQGKCQERSVNIRHWLRTSDHSVPWLVIDDMNLTGHAGITADHHVRPAPGLGLQPHHATEAINKLNAQILS